MMDHETRRRAIGGIGSAVIVVVLGLVAWALLSGRWDPVADGRAYYGFGDEARGLYVAEAVYDVFVVVLMVVLLGTLVPWAIHRAVVRRRLRSRPELSRLTDAALLDLPDALAQAVRATRFMRAAIDETIADWAGRAAEDQQGVDSDAHSHLPTELLRLTEDWRAAWNGLDDASRELLRTRGLELAGFRRLLSVAERASRGEPHGEAVPELVEPALDELDRFEPRLAAELGLATRG
jgi:hypothetical protein